MPYIDPQRRSALNPLSALEPANAGELNYQITRLIERYTRLQGRSYQTMNDVVGALEGAKAEYQRRIVAPYEDIKIEVNGDVYNHG